MPCRAGGCFLPWHWTRAAATRRITGCSPACGGTAICFRDVWPALWSPEWASFTQRMWPGTWCLLPIRRPAPFWDGRWWRPPALCVISGYRPRSAVWTSRPPFMPPFGSLRSGWSTGSSPLPSAIFWLCTPPSAVPPTLWHSGSLCARSCPVKSRCRSWAYAMAPSRTATAAAILLACISASREAAFTAALWWRRFIPPYAAATRW